MNLPTPEGLARVAKSRPLADLPSNTGKATPRDDVRAPSGATDWLCVAPGFGACVVTAPSAFYARQEAMTRLGCEVTDLDVQEAWL